jgi:hypothetical protein
LEIFLLFKGLLHLSILLSLLVSFFHESRFSLLSVLLINLGLLNLILLFNFHWLLLNCLLLLLPVVIVFLHIFIIVVILRSLLRSILLKLLHLSKCILVSFFLIVSLEKFIHSPLFLERVLWISSNSWIRRRICLSWLLN